MPQTNYFEMDRGSQKVYRLMLFRKLKHQYEQESIREMFEGTLQEYIDYRIGYFEHFELYEDAQALLDHLKNDY